MDRREFLMGSVALAGIGGLTAWRSTAAETGEAVSVTPSTEWRTFEVTLEVDPAEGGDTTRVWLPLPSLHASNWMRPMGDIWQGNADDTYVVTDPVYGARMLYAEWSRGNVAPILQVTSRFAARDRQIDFDRPGPTPAALTDDERARYLRPTRLLPTDGIVRSTAEQITSGSASDLDKARSIYDWVVDNTFRNPKTRGCGLGDIRFMLETRDLSGKCADLNALYVGLARAAGLPARDVYGVRVAESRLGFKSLGKGGDISKGQHCRAEVYLDRYGWVPVDPADVRKVALEEPPGGLAMDAAPVRKARELLFGGWETNWLAYNVAHDLTLPKGAGPELGYLMYPQAEVDGSRLDCLDPAGFRYRITSRELTA